MCHFLPLIAFTHTCVHCYGRIITTDVCRSMRKAFVFMAVEKSHKSQHCIFLLDNRTLLKNLNVVRPWDFQRSYSVKPLGKEKNIGNGNKMSRPIKQVT